MIDERNWDDPAYKKFRSDVFKRDKGTCQWPNCGRTKRLRVHHIRTWANYPELRFVIGNGIVLCDMHHNFIWSREEDYETLFFSIINRHSNDKRSRQSSKVRAVKKHPRNKKKKNSKKSYAKKYVEAKRKARIEANKKRNR